MCKAHRESRPLAERDQKRNGGSYNDQEKNISEIIQNLLKICTLSC